MAVSRENERLYALMNGQPAAAGSDAQAAAALAAAEQAAADADYSHTADGRLDRAISDYLTKSGFIYDLSNDNNYKEFAQAYSQNALRGREAAQETANMLSGGYTPTYAAAVGSEVQGDIGANLANYAPTFRALGRQEQAARTAQAGNAAQLYQTMADTGYGRGRDLQGDKMNYLGYLADRYQGERQAALQRQDMANDVWRSRLSGAAENAMQARSLDNARYQHDTQSAQSRAQLAADAQEFEQKMAYQRAEDAYNVRVAAAKEAAKQQEAAQKAAAKQVETNKKTHEKNADKIMNHLDGKRKIRDEMIGDFDYNHDGKVDEKDLTLAEKMAKTGEVASAADMPIEPVNDEKTSKFIEMVRRNGQHYGTLSEKTLEQLLAKSGLSDAEAAYVYQYFGV